MIDSLVVDEITFEEIEKENEEYRKMIAEFNKGLHGDTSNKYKSSLAEEMNLNINEKIPVLEVEQVAFLDNGVPFEYSISHHRNDKFEFKSVIIK